MAPELRISMRLLLTKHQDILTWKHKKMPWINASIIKCHLYVEPKSKKVKQKQRSFSVEKYTAIAKEVDQLIATGFIREAHYAEWLTNVVLVKKSSGKWRMWVDFIDLNKAYPKDNFPLPSTPSLALWRYIQAITRSK